MSEAKEVKEVAKVNVIEFAKNAVFALVKDDVLNIDFDTMDNEAIYNELMKAVSNGVIIGFIQDCQVRTTQFNGSANSYTIKITFLVEGDKVDKLGNKKYNQLSAWSDSPVEMAIGQPLAIKANAFVINHGTTKDGYPVKGLTERVNVVSKDGKTFNERYQPIVKTNMETSKTEMVISTIQGSKFYNVQRANVVSEEI